MLGYIQYGKGPDWDMLCFSWDCPRSWRTCLAIPTSKVFLFLLLDCQSATWAVTAKPCPDCLLSMRQLFGITFWSAYFFAVLTWIDRICRWILTPLLVVNDHTIWIMNHYFSILIEFLYFWLISYEFLCQKQGAVTRNQDIYSSCPIIEQIAVGIVLQQWEFGKWVEWLPNLYWLWIVYKE